MKRNGLAVSSNRDLDAKSSIRSALNDAFPVRNDVCDLRGIVDVPLTALRSPFPFLDGRFRHMEISAMGLREMCDGLRRLAAAGYACASVLTHPREFFRPTRTGFVYVRKNCRRLEGLLRFARGRPDIRLRSLPECARD
ncbi:hypothetical protein ACFLSJ_08985, partial [Verrucomicrobiota bacterium]